jgi:hypothetical protein
MPIPTLPFVNFMLPLEFSQGRNNGTEFILNPDAFTSPRISSF